MIKEIRKRPFARPLFVWIAGIVLQANGSFQRLSFGLLLIPFIALFVSGLPLFKQKQWVAFSARWTWGGVFFSLLLFLSIQMTAFYERRSLSDAPGSIRVLAMECRERLLQPIETLSLTDAEKSVLATITLGDRTSMSKETRRQFSVSGVAHILAVSGFHVAIVGAFVSFFLSFLSVGNTGRWLRYLLSLVLIWVFAVLSGLAASAVRAAIMFSLYLTGRQIRRHTDSYNTLAASAFCMLVYDPFYLYDIGFQLSYLAVFSILYLQPRLNRLLDVKNPLLATPWGVITVTLSAQAGVTFLSLYYFGQFSTVFLFTNIPLTLLATLLIPVTLLWLLLPPWFPGVEWLQYITEVLTHSMMWVVDTFSRLPGSSLAFPFSFGSMLAAYTLLFVLLLYHKMPRLRTLLNKKVVHLAPEKIN